jgi:K+/H+ antiporter YhaU regulatory subunit KhtT
MIFNPILRVETFNFPIASNTFLLLFLRPSLMVATMRRTTMATVVAILYRGLALVST